MFLSQWVRFTRRQCAVAIALCGLTTVVAFSGCGDGDSSSAGNGRATGNGAGAEAQRIVEEAMKPASTPPDLPPVEVGRDLEGKSIDYISAGLAFPFSQTVMAGVKGGAAALKMTVRAADTQGDASKASSYIDRAISQGADAILLQGTDPYSVEAALRSAKEADVPVISVAALSAGPPPAEVADAGLSASVGYSVPEAFRILAAFVAANAPADAHVGMISSSTFRTDQLRQEAFRTTLERLCAGCELTVKDSPLPQWQTTLPSLARTMVTGDPDLSFIVPSNDGMVPFVEPWLVAAGAADRVKIASYNASEPNLKALANGNDSGIEVANVGGPNEWLGWAAIDEVARVLSGHDPVPDEHVPLRLLTEKNIDTVDFTKPEATWFGPFDFKNFYRKLWGVQE